jgi:hypothetical protein
MSDETIIKNQGYIPSHYQVARRPSHEMNFGILAIVRRFAATVANKMEVHILELNTICLLEAFSTCSDDPKQQTEFQLANEIKHPDLTEINDACIGLNRSLSIEPRDWPSIRYNGACDGFHRMRDLFGPEYNFRR